MELVRLDRPSVPAFGRTISVAAEERAVHVRRAVEAVRDGLSEGATAAYLSLFGPRWKLDDSTDDTAIERTAWALVNILILAKLEQKADDFDLAEDWFSPSGLPRLSEFVRSSNKHQAVQALSNIRFDDDFEDLMPYVLEAHGPGSRLSVMRDPSTRAARQTKKTHGVFYTPADVADYIVQTVAEGVPEGAKFLDPSCGTGVFLLALLRRKNGGLRYLLNQLYGLDANPLSVDSCAFMLLHACRGSYEGSPLLAWQLVRTNLGVHDSLRLRDWPCDTAEQLADRRRDIRETLFQGSLPNVHIVQATEPLQAWKAPGHRCLWDLFPEAYRGFDALIGNPPYAQLGKRNDGKTLEESTSLLQYSPTANSYPLFVEMMWRFVKSSGSCSGLVVPLSIAYHQGQQFTACRRAMQEAGGHWRCAFFDREPHALFGEDVKVRNAILFYTGDTSPKSDLSVTRLLKWTSRTRRQLFTSIKFTSLGPLAFDKGMPKLGSKQEAQAFRKLVDCDHRLGDFCLRSSTCLPSDALKKQKTHRLFVASTAYNFLNVFHPFCGVKNSYPLSENRVHGFEFKSESDARLAFAILSSRLVFWLWHTQGDGFHVSRGFLEDIPFSRDSFDAQDQIRLEELGADLWATLQGHRIVSVNRGRQTIAFRPLACAVERDEIDAVLVRAAKLRRTFADTLRAFVEKVVVVDGTDERRMHLTRYFNQKETTS